MELKLNMKRTFLVGLAFMSIMLFWTMYDTLVAKMLVDNFGLNQTFSGFIMALDNILALFLLPLFGRISDKTRTKLGKRTPFIIIGTLAASILFVSIAFFDLYQQIAVTKHGFSLIESIGTAENPLYRFTLGTEVYTDNVRSALATERAQLIFQQVTKQQPGLLIGFIVVLFFVLVAMGIYRSPAVSLMPDVTPKPLRSKANAVINFMGTMGGAFAYVLVFLLASGPIFDKTGYVATFATTSLLMLLLIAIFVATVKENAWYKEMVEITEKYHLDSLDIDDEGLDVSQHIDDEKMPKDVRRSFILILSAVVLWFMGYNAATTKFSVYAFNHLGLEQFSLPPLIGIITAALAFIPIGYISQKIGRRRMILFGIVVLTIALGSAVFITDETKVLMYIIMGLVGISWASINVNSYPMVVEMSRHGNIGVYTGYYYSASMSAMIITPILSGALMDITGWYPVLFIYSAVFMGLAFIPMYFVKHGEPAPVVLKEKAQKDE
ncbi:MAG: MFS transporter [Bacilli bacterium]|jgi:maltose/moltooligosaccharide transporter